MSSPVETFTVRVGAAASFPVHRFRGELFAETSDTHEAFGFSTMSGFRGELSRQEVTCVENDELKHALQRTGFVRFIDDAGLTKLINARVDGAARQSALEGMDRARRGEVAATAEVQPPLPPNPPVPVVVDAPVPIRASPSVPFGTITPPRLRLPTAHEWFLDERYVVGKKVTFNLLLTGLLCDFVVQFALEPFDCGEDLKLQLEDYRAFWSEQDFTSGRKGEALSVATLLKRESVSYLCSGNRQIC
jgi:hypothetical protein